MGRPRVQLDPEQQAAAHAPAGPLLVVAGAGTGKTTMLVARIRALCERQEWDPARVLALTHSAKAAGELRSRLAGAPAPLPASRTFHATALRIAVEFWQQAGLPDSRVPLQQSTYGLVRDALRRCGRRDPDAAEVTDVATAVGWARARLLDPADYPVSRTAGAVPGDVVARVLNAYEELLSAKGVIDFTGLLTAAARALEDSAVAETLKDRYAHFLVDEFQDTDPAQYALLERLLAGRSDITAVGDPRQAIYAFKGADASVIDRFTTHWPGSTVAYLTMNYRSTDRVVMVANAAAPIPGLPALQWSSGQAGSEPVYAQWRTEDDEAAGIARLVHDELSAGTPASEIAVLLRFNAQTAPFEQAFVTAGIPFTVLDQDRFFDRPDVVSILRRAWDRMRDAEQSGSDLTARQVLEFALAEAGFSLSNRPAGAGAAADTWEAQRALLSLLDELPVPARSALEELAERRREAHTVTTEAVTLTTMHKAKGLEWDVVMLPRLVNGSMPSAYARTAAEEQEERRLLYVAVTRPRRRLVLSRAEYRTSGARTWKAEESPFLPLLQPYIAGQAPKPDRQGPIVSAPPDPALLGALREWRAETARASKLPEFAIVSDRVLELVATERPVDVRRLAMTGGLGTAKARRYGPGILGVLAANTG